jgi:comEA protein
MPRRRLFIACVFLLSLFVCSASLQATKKPPDRLIDLNAANEKELEELPGIGPTTAKAIIQFREKSGRFKRVEDLLVIRGISEGKLKKLRPYVTLGPAPAAKPAAPLVKPPPSSSKPPTSPPKATSPKSPPAPAGAP